MLIASLGDQHRAAYSLSISFCSCAAIVAQAQEVVVVHTARAGRGRHKAGRGRWLRSAGAGSCHGEVTTNGDHAEACGGDLSSLTEGESAGATTALDDSCDEDSDDEDSDSEGNGRPHLADGLVAGAVAAEPEGDGQRHLAYGLVAGATAIAFTNLKVMDGETAICIYETEGDGRWPLADGLVAVAAAAICICVHEPEGDGRRHLTYGLEAGRRRFAFLNPRAMAGDVWQMDLWQGRSRGTSLGRQSVH